MAQGCVQALSCVTQGEADLIVITRGGGGSEDLRQFDAPDLARVIHACPVPVVTAVGHSKDVSLADRAAFATFRTPTSAAHFLNRAYWRQQRSRTRPVQPQREPTVTDSAADRQAAWAAVESLNMKIRLLGEANRDLQSELSTVRLARDEVWTSLDTHLVAAASERVRRRGTTLSLLASAVTIGAFMFALRGPIPQGVGWLLILSVVGAVAAVGSLYLSRGPGRARRAGTRVEVKRQAVSGDEWIRRMSSANSPRELRTLLSCRPR